MTSEPGPAALGREAATGAIPALQGESLAPPGTPSAPPAHGIAASGEPLFRDAHAVFGSFAHQQVREYIQLADQKAAFLFAAAAALLAFLHSQGASSQWLRAPGSWTWLSGVSGAAMFGLAIAILLCGATVYPRRGGATAGLLFWKAVAARTSATDYVRDVRIADDATLTTAYLTHTYELSNVCRQKYAGLLWAFRVAAVGFSAAVVHLLFAGLAS